MGTGLGLLVCVRKPAIDRRRPPSVPRLEGHAHLARELGWHHGPHCGTGHSSCKAEGLLDRALSDPVPSGPLRRILNVGIPRIRNVACSSVLAWTFEPQIRRKSAPQVRSLPVLEPILAVRHRASFVRPHESLGSKHPNGVLEEPSPRAKIHDECERATYELEGGLGALLGFPFRSPAFRDRHY